MFADKVFMGNRKEKIDWTLFSVGAPGRSARLMGARKLIKYLILLFIIPITIFLAVNLLTRGPLKQIMGLLVTFILATVGIKYIYVLMSNKIDDDIMTWIDGANGEVATANILKELESDNFRLLNDLPIGRGNIDHVLIGRTGVFVIETKACNGRVSHNAGKLHLNGRFFDNPPIKQVKRQAYFLSNKFQEILDKRVYVQPVLCFVNAWLDNKCLIADQVKLTRPKYLTKIITRPKACFSKKEVDEIYHALESLRKN